MTLKTVYKLVLKYYNFGSVIAEVSFNFDHYPTEDEMMENVREYESTNKGMYKLELNVEKVYQVKR